MSPFALKENFRAATANVSTRRYFVMTNLTVKMALMKMLAVST
jgi:hypothetical protein